MTLKDYNRKRDFARTPEPQPAEAAAGTSRFVVHRHEARRLHYDLRLEIGGALKSWAVPKGPTLDPKQKEEPFGWVKEPCTPELYPSAPGEYMKDVLAEMERLNVTAVVFGDPKSVQKWKDAAPARIIPGTIR